MCKRLREGPEGRKSLESSWGEGVWLGHARISSEVLIGTQNGVVRAWTVKRKVEEEKWNGEKIKEMRGTPSQPNPSMPGINIPIMINIDPVDARAEAEEVREPRDETRARRTYLKPQDFENYGYTE